MEEENIPTQDNNPGDLKDPATGTFRTFKNPQEGYGALLNDLQAKIKAHPNWNLADFSSVYAPNSDGNDSAGYAAKLATQLGVPPNTPISQLQPKIGQFAEAVSKNEGFNGTQSTPQQQTQAPSGSSWTDKLLLGGGALLAGAGLALPWLAGPEVGVPADIAEGAAGGGILSSILNGAGTAAEVKGGLDTAGNVLNAVTGQGGSQSQDQTQPTSSAPQLPNYSDAGSPSQSQPSQQEPGVPESPEELEGQLPQAAQASNSVVQGINQTLKQTQTGSVMAQQQQEAIAAMGKYGILGQSDENGRYDDTGTKEKANELLSKMDEGEQSVFAAEGAKGNIGEGVSEAKKNIDQFVNVPDQEAANEHAQSILKAYQSKFADKDGNIPLEKWHQIAKEQGSAFDRNATNAKNEAAKSVSAAAKKVILKHTYHKEFYKKMQKEKQNIINAKKVNKFLRGKKIATNKSFMRDLLKSGGGALGIYLGDKVGGPLGAILGNMVGEKISRAADKRHGRNVFETKGMKAALAKIEDQNPAVGKVLQREIQKAQQMKKEKDVKQSKLLRLPAPATPLKARQGKTESVVVGGKTPPKDFEQAKKRKRGESEHGGLYQYYQHVEEARKAAGIKK